MARHHPRRFRPRLYAARRRPAGAGFARPLVLAAILAGVVGVTRGPLLTGSPALAAAEGEALWGCRAVDGDTLRCAGERIRLLGIDAPELPGHCRPGRQCVAGDAQAATRSLAAAIGGALTIERVGVDRYGRTLAMVAGAGGDLSCHQLRAGAAVYKAQWDNGLRVARACPAAVWGG